MTRRIRRRYMAIGIGEDSEKREMKAASEENGIRHDTRRNTLPHQLLDGSLRRTLRPGFEIRPAPPAP